MFFSKEHEEWKNLLSDRWHTNCLHFLHITNLISQKTFAKKQSKVIFEWNGYA